MQRGAEDAAVRVRGAQQYGLSVMVGWWVSTQRKCKPRVLRKKQFTTGNLHDKEILAGTTWPDVRLASKGRPVHSQHDEATAQTSSGTVKWPGGHVPGWIKTRPGKGADMNVLDYGPFGQLDEKVRQDKSKTRKELVLSAKKPLWGMPRRAIDDTIGSSENRARLRLQDKGGYFERKL